MLFQLNRVNRRTDACMDVKSMERYFDRQHGAMDRSSVFRKSYTQAMAASVEKPT